MEEYKSQTLRGPAPAEQFNRCLTPARYYETKDGLIIVRYQGLFHWRKH